MKEKQGYLAFLLITGWARDVSDYSHNGWYL